MTDLDKLRELLDSWDVPYKIKTEEDYYIQPPATQELRVTKGGWGEQQHPTVDGYNGFFTTFDFTPDGTFVRMGAWE